MDKPSRRQVEVAIDFVASEYSDASAVGYGIDYADQYRDPPYIGKVR